MAVLVHRSFRSRLGRAALVTLATTLGTLACGAGKSTESAPPASPPEATAAGAEAPPAPAPEEVTNAAAQAPPATTPGATIAGAHAPPPPPPPPPPEMMAGSEGVRPLPPAPPSVGKPTPASSSAPPAPSGAPAAGGVHQASKETVFIGTSTSNVGSVPNAERALAGMRAGFRYCYDRALAADPQAHGHLKITMKLAPTGEVKEVTLSPANVLSPPVRACIAARVQAGRFDPPKGGATTLSVGVDFGKER